MMGILKWRRCICDPLDGLDKENFSEELTFEQASEWSREPRGYLEKSL